MELTLDLEIKVMNEANKKIVVKEITREYKDFLHFTRDLDDLYTKNIKDIVNVMMEKITYESDPPLEIYKAIITYEEWEIRKDETK